MIPTEMEEMHEEAIKETQKREMRDARVIEPVNNDFKLLGLAYDYLLTGEKLPEFKEELEKESGSGMAKVLTILNNASENAIVLRSLIIEKLKLDKKEESTTEIIGDSGRVLGKKTESVDGKLIKSEEYDSFGNVLKTTNYDENGNIVDTVASKPKTF